MTLVGRAALDDAAVVEEQGVRAERGDAIELVRHDHDRQPSPHLAEAIEGLALEAEVADGEHLVHDEDIRAHVRGDGKPQARVHAAGIPLHRCVDELAEL